MQSNPFSSKLTHNHNRGKSSPEMRAVFVIFVKLPIVNFQPLGENSPNLVTLMQSVFARMHFFSFERSNSAKTQEYKAAGKKYAEEEKNLC
jgi:hypothetical protein